MDNLPSSSKIDFNIKKSSPKDKVIALAGNPNVGKSTIFNAITGMHQHTGNWPGKTVSNAQGYCKSSKNSYVFVDIPGTYSLMAHSTEEEVARDFICFGKPDAVVVVCDATCLMRNLNLALQCTEINKNVIICVNLLDEAKRKNVRINLKKLSEKIGVPVIGTVGRDKKSAQKLLNVIDKALDEKHRPFKIEYDTEIESAISILQPVLAKKNIEGIDTRWLSLRLIDMDESLKNSIKKYLGYDITGDKEVNEALEKAYSVLDLKNNENIKDRIVSSILLSAESICSDVVFYDKNTYDISDRKIDKILTSRRFGYLTMLLLLAFVFYLTISFSNYPSEVLSRVLFALGDKLYYLLTLVGVPKGLVEMLVNGSYRVLSWVVAVMLPPMAIFFPLFTLLEDAGYLPRVAYNLDKPFKRCCACGKQALTMCMGFGCNAAGVTGCRIIDSPRERLIAILTNVLVPCNGRFPALISMITMFFICTSFGLLKTAFSAFFLTATIVLSIFMTFFASWFLSKTILKGVPSSFTLELPPYRMPQIKEVIIRSVLDRTLFVLARAIMVAAPAGIVIWIMANISVGSSSLLNICCSFLNPVGKFMGLDGVILMAFILGLPANEIVIPIILMAYMSLGHLIPYDSLEQLKMLLVNNGWTWVTAVSFVLFCLMHWPCSTTLITIKKETGSIKWTVVSAILPTVMGIAACVIFNQVVRIISMIF
ncbi:MAG: ferrous iron transport protein B [Clostridia bacterium]|jgi:ferrous iron transport protein B|nr:ferrous iron transport protein B [Clostridia bacterium]MCI2014499.1 ferrous iron transport protein B [Clostridia bacterium]